MFECHCGTTEGNRPIMCCHVSLLCTWTDIVHIRLTQNIKANSSYCAPWQTCSLEVFMAGCSNLLDVFFGAVVFLIWRLIQHPIFFVFLSLASCHAEHTRQFSAVFCQYVLCFPSLSFTALPHTPFQQFTVEFLIMIKNSAWSRTKPTRGELEKVQQPVRK